jgi:cardiolipin synthase
VPRWANVPNFFTLIRLLLTPFIIQAILSGRHQLALVLFASAAATDIMDGATARHFGIVTQTGAYLDPIADKILLSGVYLALAASHTVPWWLVVVIFARDIYILLAVGILLALTSVRAFPPSGWGKLSTFGQIVTAVAWLGRNAFPFRVLDAFSWAMLWPCAALTIWSGVHYTWRGARTIRVH